MYLISKEQAYNNLKRKFPEEDFSILSYIDTKSPVEIKCNKCNTIRTYQRITTLYPKKRKHLCPICNGKIMTNFYKNCQKNNFKIIEPNCGTLELWTIKCLSCNTIFQRKPAEWSGQYCPCCTTNLNNFHLKGTEYYQNKIDKLFGKDEYIILDKNPKYQNDMHIKHNSCGFIKTQRIDAFLRSSGCPRCNKGISLGEKKILEYLLKNNIKYKREAKVGNTRLRFDFLINDNIAIEFNGQQHYMPIDYFGGEKQYQIQMQHDNYKKEYCQINNIKLIIIAYNEINDINTILDSYFKCPTTSLNDVKEN